MQKVPASREPFPLPNLPLDILALVLDYFGPYESASRRPFPLANLPLDILVLVLDYLGPKDLLSLLQVDIIAADILTRRHISVEDEEGNTILHLISGLERKEWTESIVFRSPNVSSKGTDGETPLHIAVKRGLEANVQLLIDAGAALSARRDWDDKQYKDTYLSYATPLLIASLIGNETIMQMLIRNGADVSQDNTIGAQPIHWAASQGHANAIQLLLDNGADISPTAERCGALYLAAYAGHHDAAAVLIKNGAGLSLAQPVAGLLPLYQAVGRGHISLVELLLSAGAKAHILKGDWFGISPLHLAAGGGSQRTVEAYNGIKELTPRGYVRVNNTLNPKELTTYDKILEILLQANIDVPLPCTNNEVTALHLAAFWGRETAVSLLLEAGADRSSKTTSGRTAGKLALANKHYGVCKLLGEPLPDLPSETTDGRTVYKLLGEPLPWSTWRNVPLLSKLIR